MPAAITDKFRKYSDGSTDFPNVARVSSPRSTGATTLACDDLSGWATDTGIDFTTYQLDTADEIVPGSQTSWIGVVSGNNITGVTRVKGAADGGNAINDVVQLNPSSNQHDDLVDGLLVSHNQDGTHKDNSVQTADITDSAVTAAKIADGAVTPAKVTDATLPVTKLSTPAVILSKTAAAALSSGVATQIVSITTDVSKGSITATSGSEVTINEAGYYQLNFNISFAGNATNANHDFEIRVNGTAPAQAQFRTQSSINAATRISSSVTLQLSSADVLTFYVTVGVAKNMNSFHAQIVRTA